MDLLCSFRTLGYSYEERVVFFLTKVRTAVLSMHMIILSFIIIIIITIIYILSFFYLILIQSWQLRVLEYLPTLLLSTVASRGNEGVAAATTAVHRLRMLSAVVAALSDESKERLLLQHDMVGVVLAIAGSSARQEDALIVTAAVDCVQHMMSRSDCTIDNSSVLSGIAAHLFLLLGQHQLNQSPKTVKLEQTAGPPTGPTSTAVVAEIFLATARRYPAKLLSSYEVWFAAALHGLGNFDPRVRRACVRVFQLLVPMAPLARAVEKKHETAQIKEDSASNHISITTTAPSTTTSASTEQQLPRTVHTAAETAKELLGHIFTKQSMLRLQSSDHVRDRSILLQLIQMTNLVSNQNSVEEKLLSGLSPARLREYQWDGVSWLTQLRRFGLNGVLADEMYVNYASLCGICIN